MLTSLWEQGNKCQYMSSNFVSFRSECQETVDEIHQHPCLQGEAGRIVKYMLSLTHEGTKHLNRIYSCPNCSQQETISSTPTYPSCSSSSSSTHLQTSLHSLSMQLSEAFSLTTSDVFPLLSDRNRSVPHSVNLTLPLEQTLSLSPTSSLLASPLSSQPPSITPSQPSYTTSFSSGTLEVCTLNCTQLCAMSPPDNDAPAQCGMSWSVLLVLAAVTTLFVWE